MYSTTLGERKGGHCASVGQHQLTLICTWRKKFLKNFFSSRNGPVESIETRQEWKHKKTTLLQDHGGKERQEDCPISAVYAAGVG